MNGLVLYLAGERKLSAVGCQLSAGVEQGRTGIREAIDFGSPLMTSVEGVECAKTSEVVWR